MAVSTGNTIMYPPESSFYSYHAVARSEWVTAHTSPESVENDTGVVIGGKVVKPGAITRAAVYQLQLNNKCSKIAIALLYNEDTATITDPVIRVFGNDKSDGTGYWMVLLSGTDDEITLATDPTTDPVTTVGATDYQLTQPLIVDTRGCACIRIGVQTAFAASSGTVNDSQILVKGLTSD